MSELNILALIGLSYMWIIHIYIYVNNNVFFNIYTLYSYLYFIYLKMHVWLNDSMLQVAEANVGGRLSPEPSHGSVWMTPAHHLQHD